MHYANSGAQESVFIMKQIEAQAMHLPWKLVGEVFLLACEGLANEMTPLKILTALTVFNVVMIYYLRSTATHRQLITLGAIEVAFLFLWTLGVLLLRLTGAL